MEKERITDLFSIHNEKECLGPLFFKQPFGNHLFGRKDLVRSLFIFRQLPDKMQDQRSVFFLCKTECHIFLSQNHLSCQSFIWIFPHFAGLLHSLL